MIVVGKVWHAKLMVMVTGIWVSYNISSIIRKQTVCSRCRDSYNPQAWSLATFFLQLLIISSKFPQPSKTLPPLEEWVFKHTCSCGTFHTQTYTSIFFQHFGFAIYWESVWIILVSMSFLWGFSSVSFIFSHCFRKISVSLCCVYIKVYYYLP